MRSFFMVRIANVFLPCHLLTDLLLNLSRGCNNAEGKLAANAIMKQDKLTAVGDRRASGAWWADRIRKNLGQPVYLLGEKPRAAKPQRQDARPAAHNIDYLMRHRDGRVEMLARFHA